MTANDPSLRLRAALAAGTDPRPDRVPELIRRCGEEPDFFVRDMLTWALTRHPVEQTVPLLLVELESPVPQARSQALHTLSKIGDARAWPAITDEMLHDPDDEVARTAWRTAAGSVPAGDEEDLARRLVPQLGRGDREMRLSLARAFAGLGASAESVLLEVLADAPAEMVPEAAGGDADEAPAGSAMEADRRLHAVVALLLIRDPEAGFDAAIADAEQLIARGEELGSGA